jgi:hypothetical protein
MHQRTFAIIGIVLLLCGSVPFVMQPSAGGDSSAVPFGSTKQTGLSGAVVRQAANSSLVIPKAEIYYSQYNSPLHGFKISSDKSDSCHYHQE